MPNCPYLSVVVPIFNGDGLVEKCLDELFAYLPRQTYTWEVIAVDDGSSDTTWQLLEGYAREFAHFHPIRNTHHGKGYAVKTGMLAARGIYRMFMDVDLSTPLTEISSALSLIRDHEIVVGSRELSREAVRTTWKRRLMGRLFHALIADLTPVHDTQCGFKFFRDYVAMTLFDQQKLEGWAFDVELLYLAVLNGYTVKEFPVKWTINTDSRVRMFATSFEMFMDVMSIQRLHRSMGTIEQF